MSWALRALLLLAAVTPLFAATALQPAWWQIFIAAVIGSALGQLAVRFTRGRRIARWAVIAAAVAIIGATAAWSFRRGSSTKAPSAGYLVVNGASLTWDDVHQIQTSIATVELAVPYVHTSEQLASADQSWNTTVAGTTPEYFQLMDWHLAAGQLFDTTPFKAVVLGDTVAKQLFGARQSPIGETVRIRSLPFEVVGVLAHRGLASTGQDLDDVVLMSAEIYQQKIGMAPFHRLGGVLLVSPKSPREIDRLEGDVRSLLRDRHLGAGDNLVIRRL